MVLACTKTSKRRPIRYTPAATIVAAWIRAETGVGPAIASGSHTCSGNWADLPTVPPNSRIAAIETNSADTPGPSMASVTPWMFVVVNPVAAISTMMPNMNGTSPIRVVMNALIAAFGVRLLLPPVTDQQVGADAHDLPPDQQLDQVVGHDHREHRRREHRQHDVEPREPHVAVHVAQRVDVHHQRDRGDDHEHDRGEPVDQDAQLQMQRTDLEPRDRVLVRRAALDEVPQDAERHHHRRTHREDAVDGSPAGRALAEEQREHRRDERQQRDDPRVRHEPVRRDLRRFRDGLTGFGPTRPTT